MTLLTGRIALASAPALLALACGSAPEGATTSGSSSASAADAVADASPSPTSGAPVFDLPPTAAAAASDRDPAEVLCTVNGKAITCADVDRELDRALGPQAAMLPAEQRLMYQPQVVNQLVDMTLLTGAASERGVEVSDQDVREFLAEASRTPLESLDVEATLERFQMTEVEVRERVLIVQLLDQVTAELPDASDEEIASWYEENSARFQVGGQAEARHILIPTEPGADEAAKAAAKSKAEELRTQLTADEPADFAALALEHSSCPTREQGGSLGEFGRGAMVPAFDEAAFSREIGQIGPVVETQFGYHVIEVMSRTDSTQTPLEEVKEQIGEQIKGERQQEKITAYIAGLREGAEIVNEGEEAPAMDDPAGDQEG